VDNSKQVLIVEDSATEVEYLSAFLSHYGMAVVIAQDGLEALQTVDRQKPDLIILDVNLPRMDGYQVCRRLKRDPRTTHIPVIMLTSSDSAAATLQGLEVGVDDYISKDDFATDNLLQTLGVYLGIEVDEGNDV
jgi:CheY-like chemotaxis protein